MPSPLLLEGNIEPEVESSNTEAVIQLSREVHRLERELDQARRDIAEAKRQASRAVAALRRLLDPWRHALQLIYGEMAEIPDEGGSQSPSQSSPKWDFWKKRYPGRIADAIDLLLVQGEMNAKQLCAALKCDPRTLAKSVIYQLNGAGLIIKNGGRYSLKELK